MITLTDLKISSDCWEFIINNTQLYKFIHFENNLLQMKYSKNIPVYLHLDNIITNISSSTIILHDIIYQVIDEIKKSKGYCIYQYDDLNRIVIIKKDGESIILIFDDYDSRTTARIAALQWIHQQEIKNDKK